MDLNCEHTNSQLTFRELESLPSALLSVLFALLDSRIARDQASVFQGWPKVSIEFEQSSGNAVPDCPGLSRWAAATHIDHEVKLVRCFRQLQWLTDDHAQRFVPKIALEGFAVD